MHCKIMLIFQNNVNVFNASKDQAAVEVLRWKPVSFIV